MIEQSVRVHTRADVMNLHSTRKPEQISNTRKHTRKRTRAGVVFVVRAEAAASPLSLCTVLAGGASLVLVRLLAIATRGSEGCVVCLHNARNNLGAIMPVCRHRSGRPHSSYAHGSVSCYSYGEGRFSESGEDYFRRANVRPQRLHKSLARLHQQNPTSDIIAGSTPFPKPDG